MERDACLLVNPSAGGGRAARCLPGVEAQLHSLRVRFHTEETSSLEHASALASQAAARGEAVVALSGDGMVGSIVGALRHVPGSVLGVLPGGRGNDLARVLGIPRDPVAACQVVADGCERDLDIGEVDGRSFIGIASLGFDSDANRIANGAPAILGRFVYLYAALRALAAWKHATFTVTLDSEERRFSGWSIGACNSKAYGGGMFVAPDAELDDGLLDVVMKSSTGKLSFLFGTLPRVFDGSYVNHPTVDIVRAREVRIDADRPFTVYADGDPIAELPATVRIVPAALKVLCPPRS
jgi:YegS/Rv2252/BmrU family lipid kinase